MSEDIIKGIIGLSGFCFVGLCFVAAYFVDRYFDYKMWEDKEKK